LVREYTKTKLLWVLVQDSLISHPILVFKKSRSLELKPREVWS
jgi:hypothetical protein